MNKLLLRGKTALITGGISGMGKAIASLFAAEGAKLIIVALDDDNLKATVEEFRVSGREVIGIPSDISVAEEASAVFAKALEAFGSIDIIVNCAGIGSRSLSIEATGNEFYDQLMNTNLRGVFLYCREAVSLFLPKGSGKIINIASVNAIRPMSGAAYSAAKAGIVALTKHIALRTVGTNIRCNAVCPGLTNTPMAAQTFGQRIKTDEELNSTMDSWAKVSGVLDVPEGKMTEIMRARTNRGAICSPEDVANIVLFLASDLSAGIHGQAIVVDKGGYL